ncbi:hypothetical protein TWF128_007874 [Orbilia oligospora]|nr:hypothetical protein TWF128_007874 [Orbilia oligospora]
MNWERRDILDHTDPDTIYGNDYQNSLKQPKLTSFPNQQPLTSCPLEVTDDSFQKAIDVLKITFPRMRVVDFKIEHAEWPQHPPTFGSRCQLAKIFISKFAIINPGAGEHLRRRSIKAYGYTFFENNQRLREIGTHLLASIVSLAIMKRTEDFSAAVMAAAMNKFRSKDVLSALAYVYGLDQFLLTGTTSTGEPRQLDRNMLADCFLALVAAIYQDNGWEIMNEWLDDLILPVLSLVLECQDVKHTYDKNQEYAMVAAAKNLDTSAVPPSPQPPIPPSPNAEAPPKTPKAQPHTPGKGKQTPVLDAWMELYLPGQKVISVSEIRNHVEIWAGEALLATASGKSKAEAEKNAIEVALKKLEAAESSTTESSTTEVEEESNEEKKDDDDDNVEVPIDLSKMEEWEMSKHDKKEGRKDKRKKKEPKRWGPVSPKLYKGEEEEEEGKKEKRKAAVAATGEKVPKKKKTGKGPKSPKGQNGGKGG